MTQQFQHLSSHDIVSSFQSLLQAGVITDLDADETDKTGLDPRYDRQITFWRSQGFDVVQAKTMLRRLKESRVLVLGCGGMGSMTALNLATSGVGKLDLVDSDSVELSNLNRSFIFTERDRGTHKVLAVKERLLELRSDLKIRTLVKSLKSQTDVADAVSWSNPDYIVMSVDKPYLHINIWVNRAAISHSVPYSSSGVSQEQGSLGPVVIPGNPGCFECQGFDMYDDSSAPEAIKDHNANRTAPSFGPMIAAMGALHATEIIKFLTGSRDPEIRDTQIRINAQTLSLERINRHPKGLCDICRRRNISAH
ncbi:hypothetical protein GR184_11840 [Bacillus sp. BGMRC0062]|nr:hypothetical protein [Bacillus sp. BGMRC0062]